MKKVFFASALAILALSACKESFKKGEKGLEYKIITSGGSGDKVKMGDFMEMQVAQIYNDGKKDSLLSDSRTNPQGPMIQALDTLAIPSEFVSILTQMRKGDSAVIRILTDSVFKNMPQGMPPMFKKGRYLLTTIKMNGVHKTVSAADSARVKAAEETEKRIKALADEQLKKDDKTLTEYFAKNKISASKSPLGTYVQILQPGTGANIDTSAVVKINYTGKTMDGKTFDSNTDPAFNHVRPLLANLTNDRSLGVTVIEGWSDGLKLLSKGAKAKFYIPSTLGYGAQGSGAGIAPNSILVFDIEIVDVLNRDQALAAVAAERKEMEALQKKFMDSVQKAQAQQQPAAPQPK